MHICNRHYLCNTIQICGHFLTDLNKQTWRCKSSSGGILARLSTHLKIKLIRCCQKFCYLEIQPLHRIPNSYCSTACNKIWESTVFCQSTFFSRPNKFCHTKYFCPILSSSWFFGKWDKLGFLTQEGEAQVRRRGGDRGRLVTDSATFAQVRTDLQCSVRSKGGFHIISTLA